MKEKNKVADNNFEAFQDTFFPHNMPEEICINDQQVNQQQSIDSSCDQILLALDDGHQPKQEADMMLATTGGLICNLSVSLLFSN